MSHYNMCNIGLDTSLCYLLSHSRQAHNYNEHGFMLGAHWSTRPEFHGRTNYIVFDINQSIKNVMQGYETFICSPWSFTSKHFLRAVCHPWRFALVRIIFNLHWFLGSHFQWRKHLTSCISILSMVETAATYGGTQEISLHADSLCWVPILRP